MAFAAARATLMGGYGEEGLSCETTTEGVQ
jgi:hypothetical protein